MAQRICLTVTGATGAVATIYVPVPVRSTILTAQASCSVDPGDAETIVFADGATTVGTLTFGTDIAAGAVGTYAADSTNGENVFTAGEAIKVTVSQLTAAATFVGYIEIDEFARVTQ